MSHHCPHCGRPVVVRLRAGGSTAGGWRQKRLLSSTAPALPGPGSSAHEREYEKVTPIGRLEPRDVTTALYDAAVSCGLVTVGVGAVCWLAEAPLIAAPALGSGFVVGCLRYFGGLSLAKSLLEMVESVIDRDIDGDGHVGAPPATAHTVRVEVKEAEGKRYQFAHLGVEPATLHALAVAVLRGGDSFSERTATRAGLTQDEFRNLRDEFVSRGWAAWNHPTRKQQGVSITRGGQFILRAIRDTPLPSPAAPIQAENGVHDRTQQHAAGHYQHIEE